jgi:hypothetical protein
MLLLTDQALLQAVGGVVGAGWWLELLVPVGGVVGAGWWLEFLWMLLFMCDECFQHDRFPDLR